MADKNFVGIGWIKTFSNGGSIIKCNLKKDALDKLPVNQYGDIQIVVAERKAMDEKTKATHYVYENDYKPQGR